MVKINFTDLRAFDRQRTQFIVGTDSFADLEIQPTSDGSGFHYFYDRVRNRLIKEFVLDRTPQTLTYCTVTLIGRGDTFEPRLFLKKDGLTESGWKKGVELVESDVANILVKAAVDLGHTHETFWSLVSFLSGFKEISVPGKALSVVDSEAAGLVNLVKKGGKEAVVEVVRAAVGGQLSESDVRLLVDRRAALEEFGRLLGNPDYREGRIQATAARGEEPMWQAFFEEHPWIFGYGLKLIACEGLDDERLEQITRGSTAFHRAGDRVDALMATKGLLQSLMFVEIKKASTGLLHPSAYRSGVYRPSSELSGAVIQVQSTAHRAVSDLNDLERPVGTDGWPQEVVGTVRPRQVVVIGTLAEFRRDTDVNVDMYRSFELFRRSIVDVEVLTFDELLARANFIVRHEEATTQAENSAADSAGTTPASPTPPRQPSSSDDVPF